MRCTPVSIAALLVLASGCEIYFGPEPGGADAGAPAPTADARRPRPPADAGPVPDAAPTGCDPAPASSCSCPDGSAGTSVPRLGDDSCLCGTPFQRMRDGMVGHWRGVSSSPWVSHPPGTEVTFVFRADGTYSASCDGDCIALYWGLDDDHPTKEWELQDIWANGKGVGRIAVFFDPDWRQWGEISSIELDAEATRLQFELFNLWSDGRVGPVIYDLQRCAE